MWSLFVQWISNDVNGMFLLSGFLIFTVPLFHCKWSKNKPARAPNPPISPVIQPPVHGENQVGDEENLRSLSGKSKPKDDSFEKHKPVPREANRAEEIRKKGTVPRNREDYKTMQQLLPTSDFDKSLGIPTNVA
ncbi:hypothetical protein M3Y94_00620300 [Aphelenchoides besseyi]|nr:hypothetical protein M3Y94_00620300 [Aphelenchoides besseyi]KAI6218920.1 hypothetical protein M3Y95_01139500 [Aphelenchoides besseyi]